MIEVKERPKARSGNMAFHIRRIGVIGAGQMGNGIAHVSALAGFDVKLNDLSADRIKAGIATINGNMARQVSRGPWGPENDLTPALVDRGGRSPNSGTACLRLRARSLASCR